MKIDSLSVPKTSFCRHYQTFVNKKRSLFYFSRNKKSTPQILRKCKLGVFNCQLLSKKKWHVEMLEEKDIPTIAEIQALSFHEPPKLKFMEEISFVTFKAEVLDVMRRKFESSKSDGFYILVAKEGEDVIGVVELDIREDGEFFLQFAQSDELFGVSKFAYICSMAVRPDMRRKGVARALLNAIEALAESQGQSVFVLQVFEDNQEAINLYTSSGYSLLSKEEGLFGWLRGRRKLTMVKHSKENILG
eukprot:TRINITY_DN5921_c0_g2_i1.p1 TRINITY_DN5921_c0_g2~~TRINITY_DN5921_c0_g2_i1.p1  ORF type:complete len:247 (-),score=38.01 TRINITY_DN5921_c0_g2_i1:181-921(-)